MNRPMSVSNSEPWINEDPIPALDAPTIMVVINRAWRVGDDDAAVYEATRGHWRIGKASRYKAKYVLGIAGGIVRGAYRIESWFPSPNPGEEKRWGFNGAPAVDLQVIGTSVKRFAPPKGASNPVRLFLDGIPAAESIDIGEIAEQLNAEPLARIMFGQRELFHTNLIAWFFETLPEIANRVFLPLSVVGDGEHRSVERERENLDLVFRWPDRAPLVIENKVFSLPRLGQLGGYAEKVKKWRGTAPALCLLSMITPDLELTAIDEESIAVTRNGWRHLSYDSLADSLDRELEDAGDSYEVETMRRYSRVVRLLSALIASTAIRGAASDELVWLNEADLEPIESPQMRQALHKMRSYRLAALVGTTLPLDAEMAEPGLSHGKPLVTWTTGIDVAGEKVRVGWQLQDGQFRRFLITPHIDGSTADKKAARVEFAVRHPQLFGFEGLDEILGVPGAQVKPFKADKQFGHFSPDFIYRYVSVPELSVSRLTHAATWIYNSLKA